MINPDSRAGVYQQYINSGFLEVRLARNIPKNLHLKPRTILQDLVFGPWFYADTDQGSEIPVKGKGRIAVVAATAVLGAGDNSKKVPFVVKPAQDYVKAAQELMRLERLLPETGIRAPRPLAAIGFNDGYQGSKFKSYVLSFLEHGIVPLDKLNLATFEHERLAKFVTRLAGFVAHWGNSGFSHGDAHTGNIGFDTTTNWIEKGFTSPFMVFDLELSQLLDRDEVSVMNDRTKTPTIEVNLKHARFQDRSFADALTVADDLRYNLGVGLGYIGLFARTYVKTRVEAHGQLNKESYFNAILHPNFK